MRIIFRRKIFKQRRKVKRAALKSFIQYIVNDGQALAGSLNYAPLPDGVKQFDQQQINLMTAAGQPIQ